MIQKVASNLKKKIDARLVDELLAAYEEAKHNFYTGGLRLSEVAGGRFCEAVYRILEAHASGGAFTPLGTQLKTDKIAKDMEALDKDNHLPSIRLHIPRALRVVYDIRNTRNAAHLADGIDPNLQDASLVIGVIDWILAELVRIYHQIPAQEAQKIVDELVVRRVPVVEDFGGFLKVLNRELKASEFMLVLLYETRKNGATEDQLSIWAHPKMRANLRRTLSKLVDDDGFVHEAAGTFFLTKSGAAEVERRKLHHLE